MPVYRLKTPLSTEEVAKLRVGDTVYISGVVVAARDLAHKRMLECIERGEKLPVDLRGGVVYHVNVRKYHRYIAPVCTGVGAV